MHAQTRTRTTDAAPRMARVVSSYTCPRCRQYGEATPCARCGWAPDARTHVPGPMADHEDRIIAC